MVIAVIVRGPSPLFTSVTVCGGLVVLRDCCGKDKLAGSVATAGPGIGAIFDTKALEKPLKDACHGFAVGKLVECVAPVT